MRRNLREKLSTQNLYHRFPEEKEAWLLSYADVITMLLCFFMLFYSAQRANDKSEYEQIISLVKTEMGLQDLKQSDFGDVKKMLENRFGSKDIVNELEKLHVTGQTEVLNYAHYVAIEFPQGNIFDLGATTLNETGKKALIPIMDHLRKHQDKLSINIVAYTDPTPVKAKEGRWWTNNRELSALRALSVEDYFLKEGFREDSVYLSGRGVKISQNNEKPKDIQGHLIDTTTFNFSRTITIRLESKGK